MFLSINTFSSASQATFHRLPSPLVNDCQGLYNSLVLHAANGFGPGGIFH
jgi:hypothetical protein